MAAVKTDTYKVGDYITDFENLYCIYEEKDAYFFYKPINASTRLDSVVCSIPKDSIDRSGFRHLLTQSQLDDLFAEMTHKFTPVSIDFKSVKEVLYMNNPFKTLNILKSLIQSKSSTIDSFAKNNQELIDTIENSMVHEISFILKKPESEIKTKISSLISQSLA